jgi:hypothetical protein
MLGYVSAQCCSVGSTSSGANGNELATAHGVVLMVLSTVVPERWHPVPMLFIGIGLLCVSHMLKPCVERLEQLRKARKSVRQL